MTDFDVDALYAALDARRRARLLTWAQLTREVNGQFALVPIRLYGYRPDRPMDRPSGGKPDAHPIVLTPSPKPLFQGILGG